MDEEQISSILKNDYYTRKYFVGTFSRTHITLSGKLPAIYIVNLDSYGSPGFHWISIYVDSKSIKIFDSFGGNFLNDPKFASFINYCRNKNQKIESSPYVIQSAFSATCGLYCILFAMFMSRKHSYKDFISLFRNSSPQTNDIAISKFFKSEYNLQVQE